jgi:hypothetical protein
MLAFRKYDGLLDGIVPRTEYELLRTWHPVQDEHASAIMDMMPDDDVSALGHDWHPDVAHICRKGGRAGAAQPPLSTY